MSDAIKQTLLPLRGTKDPKLELASLTGGAVEDLTNRFLYFSIFTSLDFPFATGSAMIADDEKIFTKHKVDGDKAVIFSATAGNGKSITSKLHINTYKNMPHNNRKSQSVDLSLMALEHIHNASQKVQEYKYWNKPKPISTIVRQLALKYLSVSLQGNASTSPAVNINIPKMHPMEAISFLNERAYGKGKNLYSMYQAFNSSGILKYYYDEISTLMSKGSKWVFVLTEGNVGQSEAAIIDDLYKKGQPVSRILSYKSDSHFNAHNMVKQGYASRTYVKMDFINKVYESIDDDSQHTSIGSKQMPELVSIANTNRDFFFNRSLYEPFNGDSSFYIDPLLEESFKTKKPVAAGLLNKRVSITTYGCPEVNPGDVVTLDIPEFIPTENRNPDEQYSKKYLVYSAEHSVDTNGDFMSKYELISDGQM